MPQRLPLPKKKCFERASAGEVGPTGKKANEQKSRGNEESVKTKEQGKGGFSRWVGPKTS